MDKEIIAYYSTAFIWELDDFGIDYKDIEEYYIKYGILHIKFKNKSEWEEFEPTISNEEFDFKYASQVEDNFNEDN